MNAPMNAPVNAPGIAREHFREMLRPTPFFPRLDALNMRRDWSGWPGWLSANAFYDPMVEYFTMRNAGDALRPVADDEVPDRGTGRRGLPQPSRDPRRRKQKPGRVAYRLWCDDHGHVLDDGTLFRFSATRFRLCCQERHLPWLLDTARGFDVAVDEETDDGRRPVAAGALLAPVLRRCKHRRGRDAEALRPGGRPPSTAGR